jgi:hypothetical protein
MPDAVLPPIHIISSAEQLAEIQTDLTRDPDELARDQAEERALVLLGLAQAGELSPDSMALLFVDTTSAYYDHATGVVTLTDRDEARVPDLEQDTLRLAHEFVHALQDQDVGLDSVYAGASGFDDSLARTSLIEGEATMLEAFVSAAIWGLGQNPDFGQHFTSWLDRVKPELEDRSPLLVAPRYIPYSYGARFVYELYQLGGIELVRQRLRDPPHSVLPLLLSVDQLEEPTLESFAELSAPGSLEGFELLRGDTLGPWVFGKFLERLLVDPVPADLVPAWRGDRLLVYATLGSAQTVTGLWTVRFVDADTAQRFEQLLQLGAQRFPLGPSSFSARLDRDVTIGVSESPAALPEWSASLDRAQQTWARGPLRP